MVNTLNSISFIIQNNTTDKLPTLLTSLLEQNKNQNYQINFVVIANKSVEKDNLLEKIIKKIQLIIYPKIFFLKQKNYLIYTEITDLKKVIKSDLAIFVQSKYIPQENWLKSIVSEFNNPEVEVNVVAGNIIEQSDRENENITHNLFDNTCIDTAKKYLQAWQIQTANLAVRREFLDKLNDCNYSFLINDRHDNTCLCRILRELESEITYNSNAKVIIS